MRTPAASSNSGSRFALVDGAGRAEEAEVRAARFAADLGAEIARADAAEDRLSSAEQELISLRASTSEAIALADAAGRRRDSAEVRAAEGETRALSAEARASVAEAQIRSLREEVARLQQEASSIHARAYASEQRAIASQKDASIAETLARTQGDRLASASRQQQAAERLADGRIRAAEKRSASIEKRASERARVAEERANSCDQRTSTFTSGLGGGFSPRSSLSNSIDQRSAVHVMSPSSVSLRGGVKSPVNTGASTPLLKPPRSPSPKSPDSRAHNGLQAGSPPMIGPLGAYRDQGHHSLQDGTRQPRLSGASLQDSPGGSPMRVEGPMSSRGRLPGRYVRAT